MGKTYKHTPSGMHRNPKGRKQALIEKDKHSDVKIRHKSIPPDAWDDLPYDSQVYRPFNAAEHMIEQGMEPDEITQKLCRKFKLTYNQAAEIVERAQ